MKTRIDEVARLVPGVNQSRFEIASESEGFYDQEMFTSDLEGMFEDTFINSNNDNKDRKYLRSGDVVISVSSQLATIVGGSDKKRILTLNFIKVELSSEIDKAYFVYLYNANKKIQIQKEREMQRMGSIRRLTLKAIGSISIPILPKEEQEKIGQAYCEMLKMRVNIRRYEDLVEKMTCSIIEKKMENFKND